MVLFGFQTQGQCVSSQPDITCCMSDISVIWPADSDLWYVYIYISHIHPLKVKALPASYIVGSGG
jgi:hypothetical protein